MILSDFSKAISQVFDPRFLGVLLRALGLTTLLLVAMGFGVAWIVPNSVSIPIWGEIEWISRLLSGITLLGILLASAFLMIPVAALFVGFFLERIAAAVERRFYPHLPAAEPLPMKDVIIDAIKLAVLLVVLNMVGLVIYFASTLLAPFIFWIVNGVLLSREYFQLVAMRRLGRKAATAMRKKHRFQIWTAGFLMAIPLTIPLVNLVIPVLGVASFTHMYHRLAGTAQST